MAFRIRISWKILLGLLLALLLAGFATRGYWFRVLAQSLVFSGSANKSDVIFIENSDFKYLLFERAARLSKAGMGRRVIIPVETDGDSVAPGLVSLRVAEVMCQVAQIIDPEFVAIKQKEPCSIGMARQLAARLQSEKVRSAIIVTQAFRSRRTSFTTRFYPRSVSKSPVRQFSAAPARKTGPKLGMVCRMWSSSC
jgi:hypothetical protein